MSLERLTEICARKVAENVSYETIEQRFGLIPENLQKRLAYWSFPSEKQIRTYSLLEHRRSYSKSKYVNDNYQSALNLVNLGLVKNVVQIGFLLQGEIWNKTAKQYLTTLTFDRCKITSVDCTCGNCGDRIFACRHVVALALHRLKKVDQVTVRIPISDQIDLLDKSQMKKLIQYLLSENPAMLSKAQTILDELRIPQSNINCVLGAPDVTTGEAFTLNSCWCLNDFALRRQITATVLNDQQEFSQLHRMIDRVIEMFRAKDPNGIKILINLTNIVVAEKKKKEHHDLAFWKRLDSLWLSLMINPNSSKAERDQWQVFLSKWISIEWSPFDEAETLWPNANDELIRRKIFQRALDAINITWDNPDLKSILCNSKQSEEILWLEDLPTACARLESLKCFGYAGQAALLAAAVTRTIKNKVWETNHLWGKQLQGLFGDLGKSMEYLFDILYTIKEPNNDCSFPSDILKQPDPNNDDSDELFTVQHDSDDSLTTGPRAKVRRLTIPLTNFVKLSLARQEGERNNINLENFSFDQKFFDTIPVEVTNNKEDAFEIGLIYLCERMALPVPVDVIRQQSKLLKCIKKMTLDESLMDIVTKHTQRILEEKSDENEQILPRFSVGDFLFNLFIYYDRPELAFKIGLHMLHSCNLTSVEHCITNYKVKNFKAEQFHLMYRMLVVFSNNKKLLVLLFDRMKNKISLSYSVITFFKNVHEYSKGKKSDFIAQIALDFGIHICRSHLDSIYRKDLITWLVTFAAEIGFYSLYEILKSRKTLFSPKETLETIRAIKKLLHQQQCELAVNEKHKILQKVHKIITCCIYEDVENCALEGLELYPSCDKNFDKGVDIVMAFADNVNSCTLFAIAKLLEEKSCLKRAHRLMILAMTKSISRGVQSEIGVWALKLSTKLKPSKLQKLINVLNQTSDFSLLSSILSLLNLSGHENPLNGHFSCNEKPFSVLYETLVELQMEWIRSLIKGNTHHSYFIILRELHNAYSDFKQGRYGQKRFMQFIGTLRDEFKGKKKLIQMIWNPENEWIKEL